MKIRFLVVFLVSFVAIFGSLSSRFVAANVQYWLAPGTIIHKDSLNQARLLPLAKDIETKPLPSQAQLVIDSIGVNAPIVFDVPADNDAVYQNLENGVVHYTNTPKPGMKGVSVILGHSSAYPWYSGAYGSVFALLGKLNIGDRFYVQYEDGRLFVFEVARSVVFNPFVTDDRISELENTPGETIVLVSCWPVGTNYRRIAVQAKLVEG